MVIGTWCYGNSTGTGECHLALGGSLQVGIYPARCQIYLFRWTSILLLYLDASRIQVIPISGLQVEHCFDVESSVVLIITHSEGGISVLGFCL